MALPLDAIKFRLTYPADTLRTMATHLEETMCDMGKKTILVPTSGGIDSTLAAYIATSTHCPDKVYSIHFAPINDWAKPWAPKIGDTFFGPKNSLTFNINSMVDACITSRFPRATVSIVDRCMATVMYEIAEEKEALVVNTTNLTDYLLGLHTNHCEFGEYPLLKFLLKTEVRELAKHVVSQCQDKEKLFLMTLAIDAIPSDSIGVADPDLGTISQIDHTICLYLAAKNTECNVLTNSYRNNPIVQALEKTKKTRPSSFDYNLFRDTYLAGD